MKMHWYLKKKHVTLEQYNLICRQMNRSTPSLFAGVVRKILPPRSLKMGIVFKLFFWLPKNLRCFPEFKTLELRMSRSNAWSFNFIDSKISNSTNRVGFGETRTSNQRRREIWNLARPLMSTLDHWSETKSI